MTEPVTPKAERRVIDGEVVDNSATETVEKENEPSMKRRADQSARASTEEARGSAFSRNRQAASEEASNSSGRLSLFFDGSGKRVLFKTVLWGGSLAVIVLTLIYTRPDQDWQIEHINRLQSQVAQLHETNQLLVAKIEQQQKMVDEKVAELLARPENQPVVSQADLEVLQHTIDQKLEAMKVQREALQQQLQTLSEQAQTQWQKLSDEAGKRLQPSEEDVLALQQFEQKVQTQLSEMGDALSKLFEFRDQELQQQPADPAASQITPKLTSIQLQKWMLEINAQWLLQRNPLQTQQQLLALEQALPMSELEHQTEVARKIGQDLQTLDGYAQYRQQARAQHQQWVAELKQLAASLPKKEITQSEQSQEAGLAPASAVDQFLHRLSGLVSLKKREEAESLGEVESLLQHDVLLQRLNLLIERVQWALMIESKTDLIDACDALQAFVTQSFPVQADEFGTILKQVRSARLLQPQPLAIIQGR